MIEKLKKSTLIIVEDNYKLERWKQEIIAKTDISEGNIALFNDSETVLKPITIGTYDYISKNVHQFKDFGFVIYDDAHKFPTPEHEITADIPSQNKLALASTLARSDGKGPLVLALIGPRWYEILHRTLVTQGYQVPVECVEVKIPLPDEEMRLYLRRSNKKKIKEDSLNSNKRHVVNRLLKNEITKRILIVSYFNKVMEPYQEALRLPTLSSGMDEEKRVSIIQSFSNGEIDKLLTPSKLIENMTLSNVDVMMCISHQEGSEREEYLRLGKLIPAVNGKKSAVLYSLVSKNTDEERHYAARRKKMIRQGFHYRIVPYEELIRGGEFES